MRGTRGAIVVLGLGLAACSGGSPNPASPPPSTNPFVFTISASGVVGPSEIVVPPGTRVLFVNNDSRAHEMTSDPHPEHNICEEINQVGLLNPGQQRETGNLVVVRTCGFHDHRNPDAAGLRGRIVIR